MSSNALVMKYLSFALITSILLVEIGFSQIPAPYAAAPFGGGGQNTMYTIKCYPNGSSIVTSEYSTNMTLGGFSLTHSGGADAFIAKLDAAGQPLWAKTLSGSDDDWLSQVAIDQQGNVVVVGEYSSMAQFNGVSLPYVGDNEAFVAKLNENGEVLWTRQITNTGSADLQEVAIDGFGNIFVFGQYTQTLTIDTVNFSAGTSPNLLLVKYSPDGSINWVKSFGGTGIENALGIWVSDAGEAYCLGSFNWGTTIGSIAITGGGLYDVLLFSVNPNGDVIWAKGYGGTGTDNGFGITGDNQGHIYACGSYMNTMAIDNQTHTSNGQWDVFLAKFTTSGNAVWSRSYGGTDNDRANDVHVANDGKVYFMGWFQQTMDVGASSFTSLGRYDIFLIEHNADGSSPACLAFGGDQIDVGAAMSVDAGRNMYLVGNTFSPTIQIGAVNLVRPNATASIWVKLGNAPTMIKSNEELPTLRIWTDASQRINLNTESKGQMLLFSATGQLLSKFELQCPKVLADKLPSGMIYYRFESGKGKRSGYFYNP